MKASPAYARSRAWWIAPLGAALALLAFLAPGCGAQPAGTPEQIVKKAIAAQAALKSVAMELDSEVEIKVPGTQRSATVSYDGFYEKPDRWHLNVRNSGVKSEVIILGDRTYVKLPGADSWTEKKSETLDSDSTGELLGSKYLKSASDIEMVDRKGDTYHLRFDLDMGKYARSFNMGGVDPSLLKGKKARMEVWVLKDSMNVEKATMMFMGDLGPTTPGEISMTMELDFSDFNEPVSIEPPTL